MIENDDIEYYENEEEFGLNFKKPIDPQILIHAIKKIDDIAFRKDIYK